MIGARDNADAINGARRSWHGATLDMMEIWNGEKYVSLKPAPVEFFELSW